jgi:hypothetical protein
MRDSSGNSIFSEVEVDVDCSRCWDQSEREPSSLLALAFREASQLACSISSTAQRSVYEESGRHQHIIEPIGNTSAYAKISSMTLIYVVRLNSYQSETIAEHSENSRHPPKANATSQTCGTALAPSLTDKIRFGSDLSVWGNNRWSFTFS